MMNQNSTPKLVVALDIGTTYSGYAWQWREEFEANHANIGIPRWKGELPKTTTAILFSNVDENIVHSNGFTAEEEYGKRASKTEYSKWRLFKNFKMLLYTKNFKETMNYEDVTGQQYVPFKQVMTMFIKHLSSHFWNKFDNKGQIVFNEIRWVITVPAIWDQDANNFMTECAEKSGIPPDQLQLVLEPEAAAVYCLYLSKEEKDSMDGLCRFGDAFVLADLGGGTVDITAQEVDVDGTLVQLCAADGTDTGGDSINNAFFMAWRDAFNGNSLQAAWKDLSEEEAEQTRHAFEKQFEVAKVNIGPVDDTVEDWISIRLPYSLEHQFSTSKLELKSDIKQFTISRGQFELRAKFIRELVDKYVSNTFDKLREFMNQTKCSHVNKVAVMGGMAESAAVVDEIKLRFRQSFPTREIKVVSPMKPNHAVLTGAVILGHEPEIYQKKICRYTYGISGRLPFVKGVHPNNKKVTIGGNVYCDKIFKTILKKGQQVRIDERIKIDSLDIPPNQQLEMKIDMFVSSETPKFVDDRNCRRITSVTVPRKGSNGQVELWIIYWGNEIRFEVVEENTRNMYSTKSHFEKIHSFEEPKPKPKQSCTII